MTFGVGGPGGGTGPRLVWRRPGGRSTTSTTSSPTTEQSSRLTEGPIVAWAGNGEAHRP